MNITFCGLLQEVQLITPVGYQLPSAHDEELLPERQPSIKVRSRFHLHLYAPTAQRAIEALDCEKCTMVEIMQHVSHSIAVSTSVHENHACRVRYRCTGRS